jgi:hypothetical protein
MQQFGTVEDQRFDDEKQRRIIAVAAELQRREAATLSRSELELAAAEAGIDPRFVQKAVEVVESDSRPCARNATHADSGSHAPYWCLAVVLLFVVNCFGVLAYVLGEPMQWPLLMALSAPAGMMAAMTQTERLRAHFYAIGTFMLMLGWWLAVPVGGLNQQIDERLVGFWCEYGIAQLVAILFGQAFVLAVRRELSKSSKKEPFKQAVR